MDMKNARRVDSVYRNTKQLLLIAILGVFVPIIGVFVCPLVLVYRHLRSRIIEDQEAGEFPIDESDRVSRKPGELTTEQKLEYLTSGEPSYLLPFVIGAFWPASIILLIVSVLWLPAN